MRWPLPWILSGPPNNQVADPAVHNCPVTQPRSHGMAPRPFQRNRRAFPAKLTPTTFISWFRPHRVPNPSRQFSAGTRSA